MIVSSLATESYPAYPGNYSGPEARTNITAVTIHHCLPIDETELLTPEGWKYLSDIEVGDTVMTSDRDLHLAFDRVLAKVPVREDEVLEGRGIIATREHRMLFRHHDDVGYSVATLGAFFETKNSKYIPNAGYANYAGLPLSNDEIEFLAIVQADGSMDGRTPYMRFYKPRKIDRCRKLLERLGYDFAERDLPSNHGVYDSGKMFWVKDELAKKLVEDWLPDKQFSWRMLWMSQEQAEHFAEILTYWDGCQVQLANMVERRYTSILQQNKDVVSAILAINGIGTLQTGRHLLTYKPRLDRTISGRSAFATKRALVSCVEVSSGFILIRQKGYTTIVGNCAGVLSAAQCGAIFQQAGRNGSSHYGIGVNGEIAWYVDETCVAWTNSNWQSNQCSVTIECSNSAVGGEWPVSDATLNSCIKLVADIAKRNGLGHLVPGQNLTWHSMFASTSCPGDYLRARMQYIADEANKINEGTPTPTPPAPTPSTGFKVGDKVILKKWVDYNGTPLYQTRDFYYISEINGDRAVLRADNVNGAVYCAANTNNLTKVSGSTPVPTPTPDKIKVGDKVLPKEWVDYNGTPLIKTRDYYFVSEISGDRAVLRADSMSGTVYAAIKVSNLRKV